jgi:hypothetical protein
VPTTAAAELMEVDMEEEVPIPQVDDSDGSANAFGRHTSQIAIAQLLQLSGFAATESGALGTLSDMVWFYTGQLAMLAKDRCEHCKLLFLLRVEGGGGGVFSHGCRALSLSLSHTLSLSSFSPPPR